MLLYLTGILEDGTPRSAMVPPNSRQQISVPFLSSLDIKIKVIGANAAPIPLAGKTLSITIKKKSTDQVWLIKKSATLLPAEGHNVASFAIASSQGRAIPAGRYVYDVWMSESTVNDCIVDLSPFVVEGSTRT